MFAGAAGGRAERVSFPPDVRGGAAAAQAQSARGQRHHRQGPAVQVWRRLLSQGGAAHLQEAVLARGRGEGWCCAEALG